MGTGLRITTCADCNQSPQRGSTPSCPGCRQLLNIPRAPDGHARGLLSPYSLIKRVKSEPVEEVECRGCRVTIAGPGKIRLTPCQAHEASALLAVTDANTVWTFKPRCGTMTPKGPCRRYGRPCPWHREESSEAATTTGVHGVPSSPSLGAQPEATTGANTPSISQEVHHEV